MTDGQTTDTTDDAATTDNGASDATGKTFTQEQVNDLIAREKGNLQRRYGDYDDLKTKAAEFDKLADAQKTDLQKATDRAAELERQNADLTRQVQESKVTAAIASAAGAKGIVDADAASKLLDWAAIQYDQDGRPSNLDALLDDLVKARPYLAGQTSAGGGGFDGGSRGGASGSATDMNQLIRQAAGRM